MTEIDFDRLEEMTGLTFAAWQREVFLAAAGSPTRWWALFTARLNGRTAVREVLRRMLEEPWRFPDRPRWPRFVLVPLPSHLEHAIDRLLAHLPWRSPDAR